jgi:predicted nucleic acid-binding protein
MNDALKIFVDADAFVALAREDDTNHEKAISLLQSLIKRAVVFITSNYVFSESITVISMLKSHEAAVQFIEAMQSQESQYLLKRVDEAIEEKALQIFKEQTSKNTSYVDCTNMAFMRQLQVDAIFSFDVVYRRNKLTLVSDLLAREEKSEEKAA